VRDVGNNILCNLGKYQSSKIKMVVYYCNSVCLYMVVSGDVNSSDSIQRCFTSSKKFLLSLITEGVIYDNNV